MGLVTTWSILVVALALPAFSTYKRMTWLVMAARGGLVPAGLAGLLALTLVAMLSAGVVVGHLGPPEPLSAVAGASAVAAALCLLLGAIVGDLLLMPLVAAAVHLVFRHELTNELTRDIVKQFVLSLAALAGVVDLATRLAPGPMGHVVEAALDLVLVALLYLTLRRWHPDPRTSSILGGLIGIGVGALLGFDFLSGPVARVLAGAWALQMPADGLVAAVVVGWMSSMPIDSVHRRVEAGLENPAFQECSKLWNWLGDNVGLPAATAPVGMPGYRSTDDAAAIAYDNLTHSFHLLLMPPHPPLLLTVDRMGVYEAGTGRRLSRSLAMSQIGSFRRRTLAITAWQLATLTADGRTPGHPPRSTHDIGTAAARRSPIARRRR